MSQSAAKAIANFYDISEDEALQMHREMDAAAAEFWAYPDEQWQFNFEAQWLRAHGHVAASEKALLSAKPQPGESKE